MKRSENEIMEDFLDLACALSPENLYCDGLASNEEVDSSLESINTAWKNLEEEMGKKVTETEAWNWNSKKKELLSPIIVQEIKKPSKNFFGR